MSNKNKFFAKGGAGVTSNREDWETPQEIFDSLNSEFGFTIDAASTTSNAKLPRFYTEDQDGLSQSWKGERVFCNPPYGRKISKWVEKGYREALQGALVVMLIPARTDTRYFHEYIYGKAEIRFIRGRLNFEIGGKPRDRAPFPSMIVIWDKRQHETYRDDSGVWHCANCEGGGDKITGGSGVLDSWIDSWAPNYCPDCGKRLRSEIDD